MKKNKVSSLMVLLLMACVTFGVSAYGSEGYNKDKSSDQVREPQSETQKKLKKELKKGEFKSQAVVKEVQAKLKERGYDPGSVDGKLGKKTVTAIQKFQKDKNLVTTGRINQMTLVELGIDTDSAKMQEDEALAE